MLAGINWSTFWDFSSPTWLLCGRDLSHTASWENCLIPGSALTTDLVFHHFCCIRSQLRPADGPHQLWAHLTAPLNIFCSPASSLQPGNMCLCQLPELQLPLVLAWRGQCWEAGHNTPMDLDGMRTFSSGWWKVALVFPITNSVTICEGWSVLWLFWWLSSTVSLSYAESCWLYHCNTTEALQACK